MKNVVVGLLIVFSSPMFSYADDPVPLEVWATVKGSLDAFEFPLGISGGMSYIPNFKKGAIPHAFIVNYRPFDATFEQRDGKVLTWGFSHPTDTINRYTWAGKNFIPIFTPDINGDGYRDFMNKDGVYYLGNEKDEPDTTTQYKVDGNIAKIDKFNNDNRDDFFLYGSGQMPNPYIVHFVFSNPTLKNFKKFSVVSNNILKDEKSEEIAKAIYKNKQGQWRLLTYCRGWVSGTNQRVWVSEKSVMRLYALGFENITEDSTVVTATQIDEYRDPKWMEYIPDMNTTEILQWKPFNEQRLLYNTDNFPRIFYYASMNTLPDKETKKYETYGSLFELSGDKIVLYKSVIDENVTGGNVLKHSIDGDNVPEIYVKTGANILLYSIVPDGTPRNTMKYVIPEDRFKGGLRGLTSISDINNDGFNDIALLSSDNSVGNYFAIIKGRDITNSSIEETSGTFTLDTPYPLPNTSHIIIPLHCTQRGIYSLYLFGINGIGYTLFESKELEAEKLLYKCNTGEYPSGTYIIRLTDGKHTIEKTILIQH